ncbi:uncharacterized protein [Nicotiana tomentosiformis]|uniref:uncharacterized protein n=1 Tax=Nicotiana tomentosiformis TaxID=4098 RepID=UPI00388C624B
MVGEMELLRLLHMKGVMRFGKKKKLSLRYIGPFEILKKIEEVAYGLALPPSLSDVHPVFHVSMLRKYVGDPSHVMDFSTIWWEAYERRRSVGAAPLTWQEFSVLFLEKFMPQTRREELRRQFKQLRQEVWLVPTDKDRIRRFIDGLAYQLRLVMTRERVSGATFDKVVDIARQIEKVQSSLNALPSESSSCALSVQGSFAPGASSGYSGSRGPIQSPPAPAPGSCSECEKFGHVWRQCPRRPEGPVQQRNQTTTSAPVTSPSAQPARGGSQSARGRPRGGG